MRRWMCAVAAVIGLAAPAGSGAADRADDRFVRFEHADSLRVVEEKFVTAAGNVKASYQRYTITADKATANLETSIATFEGNVALSIDATRVTGSGLTMNLKTGAWEFGSAKSVLTPETFKSGVLSPVYVTGRELAGVEDREISVLGGSMTTCGLAVPHYYFEAREVDVYPERKLTARGVTFYVSGRKLFSLRAFSIPLNRLGSRAMLPQVGQTQAEGMFLKTAYSYVATEHNTGTLKLDLMSQKGFGKGLEHSYAFGAASGNITAYHLFDKTLGADSLTGRIEHHQKLGSINMDFFSDYRSNSYQYAPNSTSSNAQLSLRRDVRDTSTGLRIGRTVTSGYGDSEILTSSFTHRQRLLGGTGYLALDYGRYGTGLSEADNQELNSRFEWSRDLKSYDLKLAVAKRYDLDEDEFLGDSGFASLDRLPELLLQSDTTRLGRNLPFGIPASLGLSIGRYSEEPFGLESNRIMFEMDTRPPRHPLGKRWGVQTTAGFRQAFYGNGAAQYVLRGSAALSRKIGDKSSFDLRYRYQQPRGASAFRFDFVGAYNILTATLNLRETERFKLALFSGYNFAFPEFPWQDITLRARYSPSNRFSVYTSAGYDVNHSRWRAMINRFTVRLPRGFNLDLGTRYDIERGDLSSARAQLATPVGKRMKLQAVAGYDGFRDRFDYKAFMLTRDLHCWEASVVYVNQSDFFVEKGFRFNLRIKAFPVFDQFGIGQRGQSLTDTSVGDIL